MQIYPHFRLILSYILYNKFVSIFFNVKNAKIHRFSPTEFDLPKPYSFLKKLHFKALTTFNSIKRANGQFT